MKLFKCGGEIINKPKIKLKIYWINVILHKIFKLVLVKNV